MSALTDAIAQFDTVDAPFQAGLNQIASDQAAITTKQQALTTAQQALSTDQTNVTTNLNPPRLAALNAIVAAAQAEIDATTPSTPAPASS